MEKAIFRKGLSTLIIAAMVVSMFALPIMQDDGVYAAKKVKKYKVIFRANKGKFTAKKYRKKASISKTINRGKKLGTLPKVARTGYTFKGWYTKKSKGKKITKRTKVKNKITLYARWAKKTVANPPVANSPVVAPPVENTSPLEIYDKYWYFHLLDSEYATREDFESRFPSFVYEWEDIIDEEYFYYETCVYGNSLLGHSYLISRESVYENFRLTGIVGMIVSDVIKMEKSYNIPVFIEELRKIGIPARFTVEDGLIAIEFEIPSQGVMGTIDLNSITEVTPSDSLYIVTLGLL